ncbi:MAG: hypothetical protein ACFFB5_13535 [Promethearchaeota archaeon]
MNNYDSIYLWSFGSTRIVNNTFFNDGIYLSSYNSTKEELLSYTGMSNSIKDLPLWYFPIDLKVLIGEKSNQ